MKTTIFNVFSSIIIVFLFSYCYKKLEQKEPKTVVCCNYSKPTVKDKWIIYTEKADIYLSRKTFKGTPLNGELLSKCAKKTFEDFGVLIPVELALSQAQIESGMGRYGRTPVTNPYNLGEYSDRTVLRYKNKEDGVQAYYNLIAKNYLDYGRRTIDDLFRSNFRNKNGYKYANSKTYGYKIKKQYIYIKEYINNNLE